MRRNTAFLISTLLLCCNTGWAASNEPQPDGINVGKTSAWTKLAPAEMIENQSKQQYDQLKVQSHKQGKLVPENSAQVQRLRRIANRIIPVAQRWNKRSPNWQWEINLIDSPDINAFCMPGGKIMFFTGILNTLKLTDDEIAIVMGHEVAHALREHGRKGMAQGMALGAGALLAAKVFDLGQTMQTVVQKGAELTKMKFSRGDETEADLVGLDVSARAGYDPRAGVTLWQKMSATKQSSPPQWLSTHPADENRIAEIKKHLPQVMPLYEKAKQQQLSRQ